jgi:uncharacterized protein (TIGR03067 family)
MLFLLVAPGCDLDGPRPELDGMWRGVYLVTSQGKDADDFAKTITWTISGDRIVVHDATLREEVVGTIIVDAKRKTVDAEGKGEGGSFAWTGIYKLEKDTLKVCYAVERNGYAKRPKEYKANPAIVLILKRVKN